MPMAFGRRRSAFRPRSWFARGCGWNASSFRAPGIMLTHGLDDVPKTDFSGLAPGRIHRHDIAAPLKFPPAPALSTASGGDENPAAAMP